jgi:hypothetical protein
MYTVQPSELLDRRVRRRGCAIGFYLLLWLIVLPIWVIFSYFNTILYDADNRYDVVQKHWHIYVDSPRHYVDAGICAALFITVFVLSMWRPTRKIMRGLIIAVIAFSIYILATIPSGGF